MVCRSNGSTFRPQLSTIVIYLQIGHYIIKGHIIFILLCYYAIFALHYSQTLCYFEEQILLSVFISKQIGHACYSIIASLKHV